MPELMTWFPHRWNFLASVLNGKFRPVLSLVRELAVGAAVFSTGTETRAQTECTIKRRPVMPAKSKAQQQAAGAALSAKRGEMARSKLKGASREMYESMTEKELEAFASTKRKGLPERKTKNS